MIDILIPYFKAGLENNEFCMWVTSEPLSEREAEKAMRKAVPNFNGYVNRGQIEIVPHTEWYLKDGAFNLKRVLNACVDKLNWALAKGYDGIRLTGNSAWLEKAGWRSFSDYEEEINNIISNHRMIAVCTYSLDKCGASEVLDVVSNHGFALIRKEGEWQLIESSEHKQAEQVLRESRDYLERLTDSMWDAVFSVKMPERVIEWANDSFRLIGYDPEECIGSTTEFLYPDKSEFLDFGNKLKNAIAAGKDILHTEQLLKRKSGEVFSAEITTTVYKEKGEVVRVTSIVRDITERKQAEEEELRKFKTISDRAGYGAAISKPDGNLVYVNEVFAGMHGYKADELIGKHLSIFHTKEQMKLVERLTNQLIQTGSYIAEEVWHKRKDGTAFPALMTGTAITDDVGKLLYLCATTIDITERKQAEDKIREERDKAQKYLDIAGVMFLVIEANHKVSLVNKKGCEILGYEEKEIIGKNWFDTFIPEINRDKVKAVFEKLIAGEVEPVEHFENSVLTRSGEERIIAWHNTPLHDEEGKIIATLSSGEDITERKQAEEALRASEEKLRAMFEPIAEGITVTDLESNILQVNDAVPRLHGYNCKEELIGRSALEFIAPRDHARAIKNIRKTLERGLSGTIEYTFLTKDGTGFPAELCASVIRDASGKPVGFVAITRDITERKLAESELQSSKNQLRSLSTHLQAMREKERASIAREIHDELGQTLTALKMDLSWLGKRLPKEQESLLEKVGAMSKLIGTTIRTVRRITTQLRPGLLDDLGLIAAMEWQAEEFQGRTGIKCKASLAVEDTVVEGELATAIFRIFQEALTNIARHANATKVKVSLKRRTGKLILKVRDNGKGITEEQVFHPKAFGIMGMKERALFWGGVVKISGTRDTGTTVTVSIPLNSKGETR